MLKALIWKEWREQRWKLAFGTVMLLFLTGGFLAARLTSDREIIVVIWIIGGLVLSLYSAMGVFAPEQSNKTTAFLASKPLPARSVYIAKLFMGWLNFIVPLLTCGLLLMLITGNTGRGFFDYQEVNFLQGLWDNIELGFAALILPTSFYLLSCALAPRRSSEAAVGLTGLIVFGLMILHLGLMEAFVITSNPQQEFNLIQEMLLYINPLFWLNLVKPLREELHTGLLFLEQGIILAAVFMIGLRKWRGSN